MSVRFCIDVDVGVHLQSGRAIDHDPCQTVHVVEL